MEGTNQKPWHGLGAEIEANLSPHEMLVKAKLDYKRPYKSPANHETFRFIKAFAEAAREYLSDNWTRAASFGRWRGWMKRSL